MGTSRSFYSDAFYLFPRNDLNFLFSIFFAFGKFKKNREILAIHVFLAIEIFYLFTFIESSVDFQFDNVVVEIYCW